ncbi:MAG: thioredoxin family protein [Burkholderiales bacterium]|nr:thioredoxin family protein [Burkholderiales bacterium]
MDTSVLRRNEPLGLLGRAVRRAAALAVGLTMLAAAGLASAQAPAPQARTGVQRVDAVEVELVAERAAVRPGERVLLGVRIRHEPHWHTYWRNPGDSGLATQIEPSGPAGMRFDAVRWPAPVRLWVGPLANYGYEDEIVLPFAAEVPRDLAGARVRIEAAAQWLVCKDVCIPGEARLAIDLPVAADAAAQLARSSHGPLFDAMAARTPDAAVPVGGSAHRDGQRLAIAFPSPARDAPIARAEFFPYAEGVVSAPAPQALSKTAAGWRLDLELADGATLPASIDGLLMVDGRPLDLQAPIGAGPAPTGTPVSVAAQPAGLSKAGGSLLGGLQGGATGPLGASGAAADADLLGAGAADASLWLALLFGVLGGAILNLMPCVFPVVGLKVIGFAQASGDARGARRAMRHGAFAFAAGVLVSFWVLAALMLGLRAAGESVGWGFQLQSPVFVAAMALLFVAVGLNFSGVFEFGMALTRLGGVGGSSTAGSFGAGVLAVLVATPCTAPFMGSALGFTLAQPAAFTMAVFTAIGLGMAAPYVVLGLVPGWVRKLPRPGRWMQTLREVLAFPMYATAAWLAWVLVQQAGADAMLRLLFASVAVAAGAWAWGRWMNGTPRRPALAWALVGLAALATVALTEPLLDDVPPTAAASSAPRAAAGSQGSLEWAAWSDAAVSAALAEGRTVFVDFTAAWCVSCQANKKLVLEREAVTSAMREQRVVALRADWTQRDPAITAALARHGRNGVPLYLVLRPGDARPRVLPELLTTAVVLDAIR